MPKRRAPQDDRQRQQRKRPRPPALKKHLYLELDDWERGYSIRQIDPDTMATVDSDDLFTRLPEPAAFRFVAPTGSDTQFVAMGTNIVVVSSSSGFAEAPPPTLVYDTAAAALATGPALPGLLISDLLFAVSGGDAVYALTTLGAGLPLAFEAFSLAPRTADDATEPGRPTHAWSWKTVTSPPPTFAPEAAVVSYAVHPDGHTVFVSTATRTHSFDTAARGGGRRREWRWHGDWALPFRGQGFFDRELGAWVGLDAEERGRVCACQVPSRGTTTGTTTTGGVVPPPESDRTEEKLFCATAAGEGGTTLAYMGDGRFCLVESVDDAAGLGNGNEERVVRVTVFGLKFDWHGKLRTTSHRASSAFVVPKYTTSFSPVVFWM